MFKITKFQHRWHLIGAGYHNYDKPSLSFCPVVSLIIVQSGDPVSDELDIHLQMISTCGSWADRDRLMSRIRTVPKQMSGYTENNIELWRQTSLDSKLLK